MLALQKNIGKGDFLFPKVYSISLNSVDTIGKLEPIGKITSYCIRYLSRKVNILNVVW